MSQKISSIQQAKTIPQMTNTKCYNLFENSVDSSVRLLSQPEPKQGQNDQI
jgi:hypothetical protein